MDTMNSSDESAVTGFPLMNVERATNHIYNAPFHYTSRSKNVCRDNSTAIKTYSNTDTARDAISPIKAGASGCAKDTGDSGSQ